MATTTKKTAKKTARKTANKAVSKKAKKASPNLKQLVDRTQKIQAELAELLALMRRMVASQGSTISTDLESDGSAKIIKTLNPEQP